MPYVAESHIDVVVYSAATVLHYVTTMYLHNYVRFPHKFGTQGVKVVCN